MRIAILGIGAMGSLFGARLASLADVTMIGSWPAGLEAIHEHGVRLVRADGTEVMVPVRVVDKAILAHPADVVLVLVKSYQTALASRRASEILAPDGLAITLQNGLGNVEILAEHVGADRAALGVTAQGAMVLEPGRVRHVGGGMTSLGIRSGQEARLAEVADLFNRAGVPTELTGNVDGLAWGKLVVNAGINALTAILQVPNGTLLDSPRARETMETAAIEAAEVARAHGIRLPFDDPATQVTEVARLTAANRSSMLQDVQRGSPTEIEVINGAVVQEAGRLGRRVPVNTWLLHLVRAVESRLPAARPRLERFSLQMFGAALAIYSPADTMGAAAA